MTTTTKQQITFGTARLVLALTDYDVLLLNGQAIVLPRILEGCHRVSATSVCKCVASSKQWRLFLEAFLRNGPHKKSRRRPTPR